MPLPSKIYFQDRATIVMQKKDYDDMKLVMKKDSNRCRHWTVKIGIAKDKDAAEASLPEVCLLANFNTSHWVEKMTCFSHFSTFFQK